MAKPGLAYCQECGVKSLRISWSSLRTHVECKQKGYLSRSGKRATLEDQRNFLPGNVSDRVVRHWLEDPDRKPGQMAKMVPEQLKVAIEKATVIKWKDDDDRKRIEADCIQAVNTMEPTLLKYITPHEVFPDFKFEAPMHVPDLRGGDPIHVTLNGYMDILVKSGPTDYYIFDVKHTKDNSYWKKTQGQMVFYSMAVKLLYGHEAKGAALLQPLAKPPIKPINTDADAHLALARDLTMMANDIVQGNYEPRPDTKFCNWCSVKHACVKFKPQTDENGKRRVTIGRKP